MERQLDTYLREIPLILVILSFVCNCIIVQLGFSPASNIAITQLDTYLRENPSNTHHLILRFQLHNCAIRVLPYR